MEKMGRKGRKERKAIRSQRHHHTPVRAQPGSPKTSKNVFFDFAPFALFAASSTLQLPTQVADQIHEDRPIGEAPPSPGQSTTRYHLGALGRDEMRRACNRQERQERQARQEDLFRPRNLGTLALLAVLGDLGGLGVLGG